MIQLELGPPEALTLTHAQPDSLFFIATEVNVIFFNCCIPKTKEKVNKKNRIVHFCSTRKVPKENSNDQTCVLLSLLKVSKVSA